jgi:hypothetical protein
MDRQSDQRFDQRLRRYPINQAEHTRRSRTHMRGAITQTVMQEHQICRCVVTLSHAQTTNRFIATLPAGVLQLTA